MYPFYCKQGQQSNKKTFTETKYYSMDVLRKSYNNFPRMKLNDFLLANISAAISQYFTSIGIKDQSYFTTSIPVSMKPQPRTIEDVRFGNDWSA